MGAGSASEGGRRAAPFEVAHRAGSVGLFSGLIEPREFPELAHDDLIVSVSSRNTACVATWQTATGAQRTGFVREGHTSIIPAGQPHGSHWREPAHHAVLYLAPSFVELSASDVSRSSTVTEDHMAEDPLLRHLVLAMCVELAHGAPGALYMESAGTVAAVQLLRHGQSASTPIIDGQALPWRTVGMVLDYIDAHLADDISLGDLAGVAGYSRHHFARRFRRSTGFSPYRFVTRARVQRARALLTGTSMSVGDIAVQVGFGDASHLARRTRGELGVKPEQLRQQGANVL